jgi:pyrroloquinoline quinone biosynthesis protein B
MNDSRVLPVTQAFARVAVRELELDTPAELQYSNGSATSLMIEPFAVAGDPPRFARANTAGHTVGIMIRDRSTGGSCAFVPGCGALDDALLDRLSDADVVLFDGTFWRDDELLQLGIGDQRAQAMGHLPISGPDGSLSRLAALRSRHKVYTHINNTNRILLEGSAERRAVEEAGLEVGMDGMSFEV